ncbi:putative metal-binding protein [Methylophaga frappieri]|uniref:Putative metal-binding protein n=1 Tax=Methylophaga frappieri (strain ATCC BAA-2434 / DSM 25690 / JAM7) TaxID=754477 RepID=I1YEB0_METFJ|nr:putative metal-binding protein [Methylophaga frappieri]
MRVIDSSRRIEVFVSLGKPSEIKMTGKGIELNPVTHPNDLYTGEEATMQFMLNGQPVSGGDVVIVKDGEKYRNEAKAIKTSTDNDGNINITFEEAGLYYLEMEYSDENAKAPAKERSANYSAVFEVQAL